MIQESLISLIQFDRHLARSHGWTMGEVEEVRVDGLLSEGLSLLLENLLGPLAR